jgi:hypothetical protein
MSLYERRRRSNVLSGDGSRLPNGGNTRVGQRGSGHLAAFSVCLGGRLDKTGTHANDGPRGEAVGKPSVAGVYTNQRLNLSKPWEGTRRTCQGLEPDPGNLAVRDFRGASRNVRHGETVNPPCNRKSRTGNPSPTAGRARSLSQRSSRQGRSLAGCKSPYRQLPVVGRLAYPMRGEVTNRVLLGRKSPGCPAGVFAAVGTIWGASKLGGRNITKYLQPRKSPPHEVVSSGIAAGSRPTFPLGKADDIVEETGESTRCTAGVGDPASKNRLLEITSGSCRGQQGLVTTCKDSPNEAKSRRRREPNGSGG